MQYKAVNRSSNYLIHFNKHHDPKNGRFTFAKIGDVVKGVATDVGRGFKGGAKVVVKGVSDSDVGEKLKKVGGGLKSVGSEVGRGFKNATNTVKKELNDPSSVDFNGDKTTEKKPPQAFKTPELNEKNKVVAPVIDKVNAISKLPWLFGEMDNAVEKWGKEYVDAADIGLKACKQLNLRDAYGEKIANLDRSWFVLEDQTFGMPQVAYLASIGKTNKEIKEIISANRDLEKANNGYTEQFEYKDYFEAEKTKPYKTNWYLYNATNDAIRDDYINKCVEIANESKVQHSVIKCDKYLVHCDRNRLAKKYAEMNHDIHIM